MVNLWYTVLLVNCRFPQESANQLALDQHAVGQGPNPRQGVSKMKTQNQSQIGFNGFGALGDKFARKAGAISSKLHLVRTSDQLEKVAADLGADLSDPEQFRVVQALVDGE